MEEPGPAAHAWLAPIPVTPSCPSVGRQLNSPYLFLFGNSLRTEGCNLDRRQWFVVVDSTERHNPKNQKQTSQF